MRPVHTYFVATTVVGLAVLVYWLVQTNHSIRTDSMTPITTQPHHYNAESHHPTDGPLTPATVVVVGAGLAGLVASIEAYRAGAIVTLLEKERNVGGNSAKATSGMNSVHSEAQAARGILDSYDAFEHDTVRSGKGLSDPLLVKILTSDAPDALKFIESFGLKLDSISQCGGHSFPRTHREGPRPDGKPAPVGWDIIKALKDYIANSVPSASAAGADKPSITIVTNAKMLDLIVTSDTDSKEVQGVKYSQKTPEGAEEILEIRSDAVVLATGGFSADAKNEDSLLREFAGHLAHLPTTNGPWATGDGVKIARRLGAELVGLDQVQIHPTGFVDPKDPESAVKFLAPEALRGHGGILIHPLTGKRFVDELSTRAVVTAAIFSNCAEAKNHSLLVLNQEAVDRFDPATIGFYTARGFFQKYQGAEALATSKGFDVREFENTLASYEAALTAGRDAFGKHVFPVKFSVDDTLYVCTVTPSIHYTMGGLKINGAAEILDATPYSPSVYHPQQPRPIYGLFGAGEVTGGVHGGNRLAGNSLLECVVFGRIAGQRAASIKDRDVRGLNPNTYIPLRLRSSQQLGGHIRLFRFDLPSYNATSGMDVGQYVSVRAHINDQPVIRMYSPCNRPDERGALDLLIKVDPKGGVMSTFMNSLRPGSLEMEFQGPHGGIKGLDIENRSSPIKKIGLIAGGTGIAPMLQIIRSIFHHQRDDIEINLIYGAATPEELVFRERLDAAAKKHPNFKISYTVDSDPDAKWSGRVGFVDAALIQQGMFAPSDDIKIIICGPWNMCQAIKKTLPTLGYTNDMFYSFM
ncbi:putative NADH-dependent fumarate reductase [Polychytrium aggregatum]|uniref:putative NADH-dependent fumarate reductase n=1 Tax=Polychytrium aggregatum TaxID=110093 RepID=UPI0022FEDDA7|nr:putative NADH-dependent fumarate reductase [Polychytrium aggregatum]KAI9202202.1 putative NADH-dependent fumarate reductase [Polychytrium aggregatum]